TGSAVVTTRIDVLAVSTPVYVHAAEAVAHDDSGGTVAQVLPAYTRARRRTARVVLRVVQLHELFHATNVPERFVSRLGPSPGNASADGREHVDDLVDLFGSEVRRIDPVNAEVVVRSQIIGLGDHSVLQRRRDQV